MGTLHQQAKISQVGDQMILTGNKGWTFHLNGLPPGNYRRCGQSRWKMFPCGAQGCVSLLPGSTADTQVGELMGSAGTGDTMLCMI